MRFSKTLPFIKLALGVSLFASIAHIQAQQTNTTTPAATNPSSPLADAPDAPPANDADQAKAQKPGNQDGQAGNISGTVTDVYGDVVPGATVILDGAKTSDHQTKTAGDTGFFDFAGVKAGGPYHIQIKAPGFDDWASDAITVAAGQYFDVTGIKLKLANAVSSVTVTADTEQIAVQQVHIEEEQRVLGFIPNFYVVYDAKNAVPMTAKLKFQMALRVSVDPVSFAGAAFLAGINQAADTPDYVQGAKGYGQRMGAVYADGFTDVMFGGAILPALLHQDPRYFYQGTGTVKSRMMHAMSNPFICRGDNGRLQPNYSSVGGDLISSAISNAYYPSTNRGLGLTFQNLGIDTAERVASSLIQEFVIRKLTPSAKHQQ